jgi:hypothetical protein
MSLESFQDSLGSNTLTRKASQMSTNIYPSHIHFIYKTIHASSGKYYIGRHSTTDINDGYLGSGKWVKSIKNKSILSRIIIQVTDTYEDLLVAEEFHINNNIGKEGCMNWTNGSHGFGTGIYNPTIINGGGHNTPHTEETKLKIGRANKGKLAGNAHPLYGKPAYENAKLNSAKKNSKQYEIIFEDGSLQIITNLSEFCRQKGISNIVFGRYNNKLDLPYYGMRFRLLSESHSPKRVQAISESNVNRVGMKYKKSDKPRKPRSPEHSAKISQRMMGDNNPKRKSKLT